MDAGLLAEVMEGLASAEPEQVRPALKVLEALLKRRFDDLIAGKREETPLDEVGLNALEERLSGLCETEFSDIASQMKSLVQDIRSLMRDAGAMHSPSEMPAAGKAAPPAEKPPAESRDVRIETLDDFMTSLGDELRAMGVFDEKPEGSAASGRYSARPGEITAPKPERPRPSLHLEAPNKNQETPLTSALKEAAKKALEEFCAEPPLKPKDPVSEAEDGRRYSFHDRPELLEFLSKPRSSKPPAPSARADQPERPDVEIIEIHPMNPATDLSDEDRRALAREASAEVQRVFRRICISARPWEKRRTKLRIPK